jgi:hypothetical protein
MMQVIASNGDSYRILPGRKRERERERKKELIFFLCWGYLIRHP